MSSKLRFLVCAVCLASALVPAGALAAPEPARRSVSALPKRLSTLVRARLGEHRSVAGQMRSHAAHHRRAQERLREREMASFPAILHRIAACESHGDPRAVGGNGAYRGAFQFSRATWASVGGRGDPADAPLLEQYRRAQALLERSGPGQWPVCGA